MIVIAESGSTKTHWRLLSEAGISQLVTPGLNPYHLDNVSIQIILSQVAIEEEKIEAVYFYGAGCGTEKMQRIMIKELGHYFNCEKVEVQSDMLAAARSLCGREPGIVCIVGTGSNSCFYDGNEIKQQGLSLGYILGDVGSGSWLGKQVIEAYFKKHLPAEFIEELEIFENMELPEILNHVYRQPGAASYLAKFSLFIAKHSSHPFFYNMISQGFEMFLKDCASEFETIKELPVHFTGSVAYHYANILRRVAANEGIYVKNIVQSPIAGLTLFHQFS